MKGFFEYEYLKFKKNHLKNLVALINEDGKIDKEEVSLLYKMGEKYELKPKYVDAMLEKKEELTPDIPTSHESRLNQLYDLLKLMFMTGISSEKDLEYCKKAVRIFGFRIEFVEILIEFFKKHSPSDVEWESFREGAKAYNL